LPLRILFIAYAVPPSAEVGVNRVASFCKYLPDFGVKPVVLTVESRFYKRLDPTRSLPATTQVIRTEQDTTPLDWYANWKSRRSPGSSPESDAPNHAQAIRLSPAQGLRQHVLSALTIPDQYRGWHSPATRMGQRLLEGGKFDAILSTSPPNTAHRVALSLKKKYRIPWIADFRDPWVIEETTLASPLKWRRDLDARLEADCVRSADVVICNTDLLRTAMSERYRKLPQGRFVTLTNGFDSVEPPSDLELGNHKPLRCLHLGAIYGGRRIDTFCAGLALLVRGQRLNPKDLKITFVGHADDSQVAACREIAGELMESGMIEFHPQVEKEAAIRFLWDADLLIVFQGAHRFQIPLKFYEYLSTGKPIFAVSQAGALSDMVVQTGAGVWTPEDDPSEIAERFLFALTLPAQSPESIQERWGERFHFRSLSHQLADWIRALAQT
jgi:glycosyltransferase involved in cell wall biosynthesis